MSAYYSANAGGRTEDPRYVWPERASRGLRSVVSEASPDFRWTAKISAARMAQALRDAGETGFESVRGLHVRERSPSDRVVELDILTDGPTVTWSGQDLRRALGWGTIKSALFDVTPRGGVFVFEGRGHGHGVGLCQHGAQAMARGGDGYREILAHYYPDARLSKIY